MSIRKHINIVENNFDDFDAEKSEREATQWSERDKFIRQLASKFCMAGSSDAYSWHDKYITFHVLVVTLEDMLQLKDIAHDIKVENAYSDEYISLTFVLND